MIPPRIKLQSNPERRITPHRRLIAKVVSRFFPEWGQGANIVVVRGEMKFNRHVCKEKLSRFGISIADRWELPDVVAYSAKKNWLFLIEAVHSANPISPVRLLELKRLAKNCTADIVFITAFLTRDAFRKFAPEVAWETEVWIADAPDHMIHFDGDKFLGPYKSK